ncbi:MAG TPA: heavy metal translocating P-type ATPase [Bryobacteraceae bacterium]|nr:heavy metal translocating P-type ATPase [Bryobacteraceae bacterium]
MPQTRFQTREAYAAVAAALSIILHLALRYGLGASPTVSEFPLLLATAGCGVPLLFQLSKRLLAGEFGTDLLAGASIVTAILLREYLVAAIVVLMLSGGTALEQYAARRASSVLNALAQRMPSIAHRIAGSSFSDVALDDVALGDRLLVMPHEVCPVDGTVLEGQGSMDESYLTGEPFLISKTAGAPVLSGAINGESAVTICVEKLPEDSRYARIMRVMQATEQGRPRLRRIADRLGAWYTPLALAIAAAAGLAGHDPNRFLAVMVIATPCPLLIAIPVAIIGAISVAARGGIIIKNASVLEQVDRCHTLIFDKTGTLTYGRPTLTGIVAAPGIESKEVLRLAASVEQFSKHPLAGAVLRAAEKEHLALAPVRRISEKPGEGLRGVAGEHDVEITGRGKLAALGRPVPACLLPAGAGLECLVFVDGAYAATLQFRDEPRQESGAFVSHLKPKHAAQKVMLVSGDRESEVRYLADVVGITEVHAGKTPEEKVAIVKQETSLGRTLYVGDGINDAPAMLAATAGVAFGHASDITAEAADAVLLEPSLAKIDELMHLSRRMRRIALESAAGGMALSLAGMIAAAFGHLTPVVGAVAQEFIDLAAVLNALRAAIPPAEKTDF